MTIEEWRATRVAGYEVSNIGRVRSLDRTIVMSNGRTRNVKGRILKPGKVKSGHVLVVLGKSASSRFIHRLVLEAFVGVRPDGMVCCHNNGDPADNRLENLRWDTWSSNSRDAVAHGVHHEIKKTHCPQGHPYSGDNLRERVRPNGRINRLCRSCLRKNGREAARKRRAARLVTHEHSVVDISEVI